MRFSLGYFVAGIRLFKSEVSLYCGTCLVLSTITYRKTSSLQQGFFFQCFASIFPLILDSPQVMIVKQCKKKTTGYCPVKGGFCVMAFSLYILPLQDKLVFTIKGDIKCLHLFCISHSVFPFRVCCDHECCAETALNSSYQVYNSSVSLLAR